MAADGARSEYVHPQHPPDKEYRDDGPRDVNYPVASCFRFPKIEHTAMVAGPAQVTVDGKSPSQSSNTPSGYRYGHSLTKMRSGLTRPFGNRTTGAIPEALLV